MYNFNYYSFFFRTKFGEILNIKDFGVYYSIFSINIFLFIHKSLYGVELVSFQKQKFLAIIGILSVILRGLTYLILLKFISLKIIFFIEAGTLAVVAIPSFIYIKIILNKLNKSKSNDLLINERRNYKKRILRYGLLSTSNEMGSSILSEVSDYYLISVYMGPTFMGLYAFPHKILKLVLRWFPITKFVNMIRPLYLDKYYENNENKEYLQKMFNFMIKIMMLIYGIITSIVITYQNLINEYLFASKYKNTESLLIIIFTFSFLSFFIHPVNLIMEATENIQYNLYAKIFAIINVFSVIMILKFTNYGLFGVAIATGLSNFLKNYFIYFFMKQRIRIFFNKVDLLKSSLVIIIFFIIIQIGYKIPYLYLKIFLPLICGSFFIMFFINKIMLFNFEERKQILKIFNKNYTIRKFIRRISGKVY